MFKMILSNPSPQLPGSTHSGTSVVLSILNLRLPANQVELVGEHCVVRINCSKIPVSLPLCSQALNVYQNVLLLTVSENPYFLVPSLTQNSSVKVSVSVCFSSAREESCFMVLLSGEQTYLEMCTYHLPGVELIVLYYLKWIWLSVAASLFSLVCRSKL